MRNRILTMMIKNSWQSFGASIRGQRHIRLGEPNQDTWRAYHDSWVDLVVVCDGLGSLSLSGVGSRMACLAAEIAAREIGNNARLDPADFTARLHSRWLKLVGRGSVADCGCTCLFALAHKDELVLGQLGDGMIATVGENPFTFTHEYDFLNVTDCLEDRHYPELWHLATLSAEGVRAVVLSTDGVSADIPLACRFGMAEEFFNEFGHYSATIRCRKTEEALRCWPVPDNTDDKTLACLGRVQL